MKMMKNITTKRREELHVNEPHKESAEHTKEKESNEKKFKNQPHTDTNTNTLK